MSVINKISNLIRTNQKPSYEFVEKKIEGESDLVQMATKITSGKHKGLIFSTGPVTIQEDQEKINLNYQYRIEFLPKDLEVDDELLSNTIGDIIMEEIEKSQQDHSS